MAHFIKNSINIKQGINQKEKKMDKVCALFGHRQIIRNKDVCQKLEKILDKLIKKGISTFFVGTHGDFDKIALSVCQKKKMEFDININLVFTSLSNLNNTNIPTEVNSVIFDVEEEYFKQRIILTNKKIIDISDIIIIYYNSNKSVSGVSYALNYALKKNKKIINIYDKNDEPLLYISNEDKSKKWNEYLNKIKRL